MAAPQVVLDYVEVLVWPAVVAVVLVLFRHQVARLIDRIQSVKFGGAELSAESRVAATIAADTTAMLPVAAPAPSTRAFEGFRTQAAVDPAGAVKRAWSELRRQVRSAVETAGLTDKVADTRFTSSYVSALVGVGLPTEYVSVTTTLNRIRLAMDRAGAPVMTEQAALDFIGAATDVYVGVGSVVGAKASAAAQP